MPRKFGAEILLLGDGSAPLNPVSKQQFDTGIAGRAAANHTHSAIVGRMARTTDTAAITTTETRVLSVRAPVVTGRMYRVSLKATAYWTTSSSVAEIKLRHTTNDVEPTTSSAILDYLWIPPGQAAVTFISGYVDALFVPSASGFLRVLATVVRVGGTGAVTLPAAATYPMVLTVEDIGEPVLPTGTVY